MTIWGDINRRSQGNQERKEDKPDITSKEELIDVVLKIAKSGEGNLHKILDSIWKRIKLDEIEGLFEIEDNYGLSDMELLLLQTSLCLPFKLLSYCSLEVILKDSVRVIIDPRTPKRIVPPELEEARRYWEKMVLENPNDAFAGKMLEEVKAEIEKWKLMLLLGLYDSEEKIILLFPNNMKRVDEGRMPELLVSTLAHEVMHAYFDRPSVSAYPYVYSVEEPMAEFGMLLYLKETCLNGYFGWAKEFVGKKKTCYRYGATLMEQCEKEGSNSKTRKDFEYYKVVGSTFTFHLMSSVSAKPAKHATSSTKKYEVYDLAGCLIGSSNYMRDIPLIIIRDYCDSNSGITYSDLNKLFNVIKCYNVPRYPGIVVPKKEVDAYEADLIAKGKKPDTRVHSSSITLVSGEIIYITNQWAGGVKGNFDDFSVLATKLGYVIIK